MPIAGGLDIRRRQLTFDYPGTATGQVRRGRVSPADREHLRAWLARFAGRSDVAFAVEGCTGWRYAAGELAAAGVTVHLAEPAGTAFARGRKRHAKTDKTDARHLRALLAEGWLPGCWIPPGRILECRALLELYNDLRRECTAWCWLGRLQAAPLWRLDLAPPRFTGGSWRLELAPFASWSFPSVRVEVGPLQSARWSARWSQMEPDGAAIVGPEQAAVAMVLLA